MGYEYRPPSRADQPSEEDDAAVPDGEATVEGLEHDSAVRDCGHLTISEAKAAVKRRKQLATIMLPKATIPDGLVDAAAARACDGGNEQFERGLLVVSQRDHLREVSGGHKDALRGEIALSAAEIAQCQEAEHQANEEAKSFKSAEPDGAAKASWTWSSIARVVLYLGAAIWLTLAIARVGGEFMAKNAEGQGLVDRTFMLAFLPLLPMAIAAFYSSLSDPGKVSDTAKRFWIALNVITWPFAVAFVILLAISTSTAGPASSTGAGGNGSRWGKPPATAAASGKGLQDTRKIFQIATDILVATVFEISAYQLILAHSPMKTREPQGRKDARKREQEAAEIRRFLEPAHVDLIAAKRATESWIDSSCRKAEDVFTKRVIFLGNINEKERRNGPEENGLFG